MTKRILVNVAWPYVNGDIHVGHLAGYLLPADVFARWARLKGYHVLMVSGADCHGTPITVEAEKRGLRPEKLIDIYLPKIRKLIATYDLSYDIFTSTRTAIHHHLVQEFFLNLLKNGYILKKKAPQYYSPTEKRFLPDRYVEGECPYCHSPGQRADQCEVCGRVLNFGQLIKPQSKLTNQPVILKESEHYYLDYPKLAPKIKEFVNRSSHWRSWVYQETLGWLKEGLEPRPITRDINWGVPLPEEKIPPKWRIENIAEKRFYVWFDAVIGYVSATYELAKQNKDVDLFKKFWFSKDSYHYYFMGQDNLAFHTIFWPGQLIGQEKGYTLPYQECVNKFLNLEGKKFSKSRGIIIDSLEVGHRYGPDLVRFYLLSILPENKEATWHWSEFFKVVNGELVNNIANFVQRVVILQSRFVIDYSRLAEFQLDKEVREKSRLIFKTINQLFEKCQLSQAMTLISDYSRFGNLYLSKSQPWLRINDDLDQSQKSLINALYIVYHLGLLLAPFLPTISRRIFQILGAKSPKPILDLDSYQLRSLNNLSLKPQPRLLPLVEKLKPPSEISP